MQGGGTGGKKNKKKSTGRLGRGKTEEKKKGLGKGLETTTQRKKWTPSPKESRKARCCKKKAGK